MLLDFLTAVFFPPTCAACGKHLRKGTLCDMCRADIALSRTLFCAECRMPLLYHCHPDRAYVFGAAASYGDRAVKTLIHALKFQGVRDAAEPLASLLIDYVSALDLDRSASIVVPIPLSKRRLRSRGFNQSELIARIFAERFLLPLETDLLIRTRHSKPQSETTSTAERKKNVRDCFSVAAADQKPDGRRIILIDDVTTSGATFREAAQALGKAGAKHILPLAVAMV